MAILASALAASSAASIASPRACSRTVLDNGLVAITSHGEAANIVAIEALIKTSVGDEPPHKAGLRQMVQQMLVRGSEGMSGEALARALDAIGAELDTGLTEDYVQVQVVCLAQDLEPALRLLADIVRRPAFPEREVEGQRRAALAFLQRLADNPFETTQSLLRQGLYGEQPYARSAHGTRETLNAITRADIVDFHRCYYVPNNTIIAVAGLPRTGSTGAAPADAAAALVRRYFGDWQKVDLPPTREPAVKPLERSTVRLRQAPVGQAYFMLGYLVGPPARETYAALDVIRALLGRGMGSRFFSRLRDGESKAYEADAYQFALAQGGYVAAFVATGPRELEATKQAIAAEFARLSNEPVGADELRRAQEYAAGTHILSHQRARERVMHLAWYEATGLGCDFDDRYAEAVKSVTASQIQALARDWFGHYALGLVLPAGEDDSGR
jgi:zinc protease